MVTFLKQHPAACINYSHVTQTHWPWASAMLSLHIYYFYHQLKTHANNLVCGFECLNLPLSEIWMYFLTLLVFDSIIKVIICNWQYWCCCVPLLVLVLPVLISLRWGKCAGMVVSVVQEQGDLTQTLNLECIARSWGSVRMWSFV